ncbi:hypothetical protein F0L74_12650 [Chitinophaga agrisoli]|uniref:Uncharacterized protein n=1 Tax=Chitinophaga agrisoli TaxID=2607653 RepID=A0A5B2VYS0_9BACT|nr:hypothetical protein [Chitinophaga agrisoli]KAA2243347.1 hypothetical protein F0L74_12650 [Chitinophaga agrisoli]
MEEKDSIFDADFETLAFPRRKKLLPWWIKTFAWIFLILSFFVPVAFVLSFLGFSSQMELYGIKPERASSVLGLILMALFVFKGIAAFGLLKERDWAIIVGMTDAVIGIVICTFMMIMHPFGEGNGFTFNFRLELVLLIPYLIKLIKIRVPWAQSRGRNVV